MAHAIDGLVHVLHTHKHMRYHFVIAAVVLVISALLRVSRIELLLLCAAITLVVLAELVNSAIETAVDLVSPEHNALAKVAKDVASAAVLVSCVGAILVGAGVFISRESLEALQGAGNRPAPHFLHVALVGVVTVLSAVIVAKLWGGRGTVTRGGVVSAHSALAFFCFVSVWFLAPDDIIIRALAFVLAVLVAQSRVESGIHSLREVLIGVVVALVVGIGLYGAFAMRTGS
ncbi:MAG: diacylglycerol kinase [Armatimonadota bacterium]|nr:MAG: diacylglycerol kinase [Armatimonadota bacterium]